MNKSVTSGSGNFEILLSEQKRYENAILDDRNYLQAILDTINEAVFVYDADTAQIIDVNRKMCEMYGYSREEVLSVPIGELSEGKAPYSQAEALEWLRKAKEQGAQIFEWRAKRKNGELFWVEVTINFVQIGGQNRFVVTARDIEYKKRMDSELKKAAEDWQKTFDSSRDAIWIMDKNNRIIRANKTVESMLNIKIADLLGKPCWTFIHGKEPHPDCPQSRAMKSLRRETMEFELHGKWLEITVDPILDSNGDYDGAIHIVADINEKKMFLQELAEREKKFRNLVEYSQTHIYTISKERTITFSSPIAKQHLGLDSKDLLGKDYKPLIHSSDLPAFEHTLDDIFSGKQTRATLEYRVKHADGAFRWHRSVLAPIPDETGEITSVIGNAVDISQQMTAEEQFKMLFEQMLNGFALHEIILDENEKPADYRFLNVNPAFEKLTGLKGQSIIGKTAKEVLPNIKKTWIDVYGKVALTGTPAHFEEYSPELGKWFDINAFSPAHKQFACIFSDITEKKKIEITLKENLEELRRWQSVMLDYSDRSQQLKREINQLLEQLGEPPRYLSVANKN